MFIESQVMDASTDLKILDGPVSFRGAGNGHKHLTMVRPAIQPTCRPTWRKEIAVSNPSRRGEGGISYASYVTGCFESGSRLTLIAPRYSHQQLRSLIDLSQLLAVSF